VADIGRLRGNLGIERWLVYGASWDSILVLTYAERHPERAAEMVIAAVPMTRRSEIQWLYHGVGRFFRVEDYARLLAHSDANVQE
jgi:proline iminopeptidase